MKKESIVLLTAAISLFLSMALGLSILYALSFSFFLFFFYGISEKRSVKEMLSLAFLGIKTVKNILLAFVLIGIMTALWRASGTIAFLVYNLSKLLSADLMLLLTFLFCALLSILTGTSLGTASTIGLICATMASSIGLNPVLIGGAVLSGSYVGDRCSAMSTSALLVASITETDLFHNIKTMVKTSIIPFLITCIIYIIIAFLFRGGENRINVVSIFSSYFNLSVVNILPAIIVIALSLMKRDVKLSMTLSILSSALIAIFLQGISVDEIIKISLFGFHPDNAEIASLLSGGGITSMINVFFIVLISSSYSEMLKETGLLVEIESVMEKMSEKITSFGSVVLTSILVAMISCNQTLTIMLTSEICTPIVKDKNEMASYLEDSAVVIAALIPWSIASAVPLGAISAPHSSILFSFYLFLLPISSLAHAFLKKQKGA